MGDNGLNALLNAATASAGDAQMLCEDIAQQLFPRAPNLPSEAVLASTRLTLQKLVSGIETALGLASANAVPQSWDILCRSGLLREPALLEFALARLAEEKIGERLDHNGTALFGQISTRLLQSDDAIIADCARALLLAENLAQLRTADSLVKQLPADLLHLLVWRVVAVFQMDRDTASGLVAEGQRLLCAHDEAEAVGAAAAKLVYFLPDSDRAALDDPLSAGLALYVSGLAQDFRLPHDRILRFIDEDHPAPLLLMLRARGHDAQAALSIVQYLRGRRADDQLLPELLQQFGELDPKEARAEILRWRLGASPVWKAG